MPSKEEMQEAIEWFTENNIRATIDDNSTIYVFVNDDVEVQISSSEVVFRAEQYREKHDA